MSKTQLIWAMTCVTLAILAAMAFGQGSRPGAPLNQACAILGTCLLLAPFCFFIAKRSGFSASPPFWFALHALCGFGGITLIAVHVGVVTRLSPAVIPLAALVFLVVQGFWVRAFLTQKLSFLFARSPKSFHFGGTVQTNRTDIAAVIARKDQLLPALDASAQEALFSPQLRHWLRHPVLALRYDLLARKEARLVGARARAGLVLSYARQVHILVAGVFYLSLLAHVVVMLFFAGYAAKGGEIYWWHIADWGRK